MQIPVSSVNYWQSFPFYSIFFSVKLMGLLLDALFFIYFSWEGLSDSWFEKSQQIHCLLQVISNSIEVIFLGFL